MSNIIAPDAGTSTLAAVTSNFLQASSAAELASKTTAALAALTATSLVDMALGGSGGGNSYVLKYDTVAVAPTSVTGAYFYEASSAYELAVQEAQARAAFVAANTAAYSTMNYLGGSVIGSAADGKFMGIVLVELIP